MIQGKVWQGTSYSDDSDKKMSVSPSY